MCSDLKNTFYMLKYEYEYDENVEFLIYHPTFQSLSFQSLRLIL